MPGVIRVQSLGVSQAQLIINTWDYKLDSFSAEWSASMLEEFAGGFIGVMQSPLLACLPVTYSLQLWKFQEITGVIPGPPGSLLFGLSRDETPPAPSIGTVASPPSTNQVAATIARKSSVGGRRGLGHIQVGPLPESFADDSAITPTGQVPLGALAAAMLTPIDTIEPGELFARCVVMSVTDLFEQFQPANPWDAGHVVDQVFVRSVPGTQRTRKPRPS